MSYTDDPNHPELRKNRGDGQQPVYLVLSAEERAKGFVAPLRRAYTHKNCGTKTTMGLLLCETYARDPKFYGATFCTGCGDHYPIAQFNWVEDGKQLGEI